MSWKELYTYWFGELSESQDYLEGRVGIWFSANKKIDLEIEEKFSKMIIKYDEGQLDWSAQEVKSHLAFIILLDQIPRHLFRKTPKAHHYDEKSLALAENLIQEGKEESLHALEKFFLYLPFQHSEDLLHQERSREYFDTLYQQASENLKPFFKICSYKAELHYRAIKMFGRFPHRNHYMARVSSESEKNFLKNPEHHF